MKVSAVKCDRCGKISDVTLGWEYTKDGKHYCRRCARKRYKESEKRYKESERDSE
jgi:formylmethanofuran dehydrogenase subunit E